MATVEEGLQAQIRNIEATYGKPMAEWLAIIAASGLTKHTEVVAMLKREYGMTHGAAHRVSLVARQAPPRPLARTRTAARTRTVTRPARSTPAGRLTCARSTTP